MERRRRERSEANAKWQARVRSTLYGKTTRGGINFSLRLVYFYSVEVCKHNDVSGYSTHY